MEELPLDAVVEGVNGELDLVKSFPVYQAVPLYVGVAGERDQNK